MTVAPAGDETRVIRANGQRAQVRLDGPAAGPVRVFANAPGADLRVWNPRAPALAGKRLGRCEQRGHGRCELTPGPDPMAGLADDLAASVDALGLVRLDTAPRIGTAELRQERIKALEAAGCAAIRDAALEAALAVTVPASCVVGEHDGATPPDRMRGMASTIPAAAFELIADEGPLPQLVRPGDVAACPARFESEAGLS
ncbi:MAG: alpha/beta fold hydrolase [Alphaproteobacteria bacterium]